MKIPAIRTGLLAALLLPALAQAHTGAHTHEAASFYAGLLHPLTGLDHLAAMVALGVCSALALRRAWLAPAAFVLMLAVGAIAGLQGLGVPAIEPMIASSLLVLGLLVAVRRALPLSAALALAGFFAFFHGAAHGYELASEQAWAALAGMLLTTATLHGLGILLGRQLYTRQRWLAPATGSAVALLGSALLLGLA